MAAAPGGGSLGSGALALAWRFSLAGAETGIHHLRVKNIGTPEQDANLDGVPIEAPPGTMTFTGPRGCLLQLVEATHTGGWTLLVDGIACAPYDGSVPSVSRAKATTAAKWKFSVPGGGTHQLRVKSIGLSDQEVFIDATPVAAPPGTLTFTGPAGTLLELRETDGGSWALFLDGALVEDVYGPGGADGSQAGVLAEAFWKFSAPDLSLHEVRVTNVGDVGQSVFIDGDLIQAPVGTMTFTGPVGVLLELRDCEGAWTLLVDGVPASKYNPSLCSKDPPFVRNFVLTQLGKRCKHEVRVIGIGRPGQEVFIDGTLINAPDGTMVFTGPGGSLLELKWIGDAWELFVDGVPTDPSSDERNASPGASWIFSVDGCDHMLWVADIAGPRQRVVLDGVPFDAPEGTMTFTGPGGRLIELKRKGPGWSLLVDNVEAEPKDRQAIATEVSLPQGVSYCAETNSYTAALRVGGKFTNLGSFLTPGEAHSKYLEAKEKHR